MNIAVVGLGLIGGSLLRSLAAAGHQVLGYDADPAVRATARTAAAKASVDHRWQIAASVGEAGKPSELVILAVPLTAVAGVLDELVDAGFTGLITDVTSVKGPVRDLVEERMRRAATPLAGFVGGHPMVGREQSGFEAADPYLFTQCAWVLCLEEETSLPDWLHLAALVTSLGARVVPTTAADHDRSVARVSHLPHLLAAALAASIADDPLSATLAAGSFRDGTRVATTRPELTAEMAGGNAEPVAAALDSLLADLDKAGTLLHRADPVRALLPWLRPGHDVRTQWPALAGDSTDLPARADVLRRLGGVGGWIIDVADDRRTVTAVRPARP
ncbi:MAG: prephenate dehydrogenase/arogenate dehydrogenase family protein [Hamadaea sp.]|nr:prephenate dehydrogenase/arogenate dehydrogenase family protein [Hamadaea sp.]NUR47947.1 prephenate dehydrogenase/arogenate dehydrogenase family protein [Hamadaea sp.]NUT07782.1 prephenate dehydrogenase/arogenate dehydrogenase family protein [Hamadaea sp.]